MGFILKLPSLFRRGAGLSRGVVVLDFLVSLIPSGRRRKPIWVKKHLQSYQPRQPRRLASLLNKEREFLIFEKTSISMQTLEKRRKDRKSNDMYQLSAASQADAQGWAHDWQTT